MGQQNTYYAQVGKKRILRLSRLVKDPEALHYDFDPFEIISLVKETEAINSHLYPCEIVLYKKTKHLTCLQLKTNTQNIKNLTVEKSYAQLQHQLPP